MQQGRGKHHEMPSVIMGLAKRCTPSGRPEASEGRGHAAAAPIEGEVNQRRRHRRRSQGLAVPNQPETRRHRV